MEPPGSHHASLFRATGSGDGERVGGGLLPGRSKDALGKLEPRRIAREAARRCKLPGPDGHDARPTAVKLTLNEMLARAESRARARLAAEAELRGRRRPEDPLRGVGGLAARFQVEAGAILARRREEIAAAQQRLDARAGDLERFKVRHDRESDPQPAGGRRTLAMIVLAAIAAHIALNGFVFLQSAAAGWTGPAGFAVAVAALNAFLGVLAGHVAARQLWRRESRRKLLGAVALGLFLLAVIALNLLAARYRDALSLAPGSAAEQALAAPWAVGGAGGLLLVALGIAIALIIAKASFAWDDPYPGYGRLARARDAAHAELARVREGLTDELEAAFIAACNRSDAVFAKAEESLRACEASIARSEALVEELEGLYGRAGDAAELALAVMGRGEGGLSFRPPSLRLALAQDAQRLEAVRDDRDRVRAWIDGELAAAIGDLRDRLPRLVEDPETPVSEPQDEVRAVAHAARVVTVGQR